MSRVALGTVAVLIALAPAASAASHHKSKVVGMVYTETNGLTHNSVIAFARSSNGRLKQVQSIRTGGKGGAQQQPGCTAHCPILDTQGEVDLTSDGRFVFAVNPGSNSVSAFRVTSHGLTFAGKHSSSGVFPSSLTSFGNRLYVLNANSLNIAGFRFSSTGKLKPIKGSKRSLSSGAMPGTPRQIGIDNTGRVLAVTLLMPSVIDTFAVKANGTPGAAVAHSSNTPFPFGFAVDPVHNHLVVSQLTTLTGTGSVGTYRVTKSAALNSIDAKPDFGIAPCWVAITPDGRYAFVVNTAGPPADAVSRFALASDGKLTFLGGVAASTNSLHTDEVLSRGGRYLYVLQPGESSPSSHIDEYKVGPHGGLKLIGHTRSNMPTGVSGLVGR